MRRCPPAPPPRTAHVNLARLRDVYLHTNTLAALANLAPHLSGEAALWCCMLCSGVWVGGGEGLGRWVGGRVGGWVQLGRPRADA